MKRIKNKIFAGMLLVVLVIQGAFGLTSPAAALFGVSIPSPSQVADQFEKRYNISADSIRDQAQTFNVAANKKMSPQVSIIFDPSDPKPGSRLTARAFPLYFNGPEDQLYFTWYLQRSGCSLDASPSSAKKALCDEDRNDRITVEDWKIAAMGELVRNGYNNEGVSYTTDSDSDGYRARFGDASKVNTPNYCYFHDNESGNDYEIADTAAGTYDCPSGKSPVCVVTDQVIEPGTIPSSTLGTNPGGETLVTSAGTACFVAGAPICGQDGTVKCGTGEPKCISDTVQNDCGEALTSCTTTTAAEANPVCRHLFPNAPGEETGDGTFGPDEEKFWRTNPADDSTAENGNKDEANLVGLGQTNFSWNYASGDQVGVVVEGSSLFPSKHDDSSYKTMWAFSKNDCPISLASGTGSYTQNIKGYQVTFPTANIDLNECLARNLIDPTQGGQSTNLELQMVTSPENPVNDETTDQGGDRVVAQAIVNNGQKGVTEQLFEWRVEISNNPQFNSSLGTVADITRDLVDAGILRQIKGNALDTLELPLNITRDTQLAGRPLSSYLSGEQGYLRISVRASENFSSGIVRKGKTDTIIPFTSTRSKIIAYKANPTLVGDRMRVAIPSSGGIICQDARLDRAVCRVLQNEIIGMQIDTAGLSNFQWSINGTPLTCGSNVSPDCAGATQGNINFFPVSGASGSSYTVSVTASDVSSGKTVTVSRLFQVVDPTIGILSSDQSTLAPKFLGQYIDVRGEDGTCDGGLCGNYSGNVLEGTAGKVLKLKAVFIPSFLAQMSEMQWEVNGNIVTPTTPAELTVDAANSLPGEIVNVTVRGVANQDTETRRALADTWGISQLDSSEKRFEKSMQIEIVSGPQTEQVAGIRKYFAALGTYIPATLLYTLQMFLAGALTLFVVALLQSGVSATQRK